MPNPNPKQSPEFLAQQKPRIGSNPLCKPIPVRFEEDVDAVLRAQNNRQDLIRRYVREGLKRDGLI